MALVNRLDPLIPTFLNLEWIVRGLDVCLVWSVDNEALGIRRMMQIGEVHGPFQRLDQERHRDILVLDEVRLDGDRGMFLIEDIVLQMSLEQWLRLEVRDEVWSVDEEDCRNLEDIVELVKNEWMRRQEVDLRL
jgi:hypothetical protein